LTWRPPVGGDRQRDPAEDELRVEPVAALLEITAVGHLRDHVGGAEEVPHHDVVRVPHACLDLGERQLVAGEMDDLARDRHPGGQADLGQELLEEARAAGNVDAGEFRAVARFLVVGSPQVADIVEQAGDETDHRPLPAEALRLGRLTLVPDEQPGQREGDVERVLAVVVDGVHPMETGNLAREQPLEMLEGPPQGLHGSIGPGGPVKRLDRAQHRLRGAHLDGIGDIEVTAPGAVHSGNC
jgi:hypothetical protein